MKHKVVIHNGVIKAIYDDTLLPVIKVLEQNGGVEVTRATHVEPCGLIRTGARWRVDLTPSGGPIRYCDEQRQPFEARQQALDFERRWLEQHFLGCLPTKEVPHPGSE